jgi:hypothetical protein
LATAGEQLLTAGGVMAFLDIRRYLNRDLLLSQWPVLRVLIGRHVSKVWEAAFPELGPV